MKLKYYLRGLGVGIICTAILMGIALSGNKKEKLTDTEIIERAKLLGMVMADESSETGGTDAEGQDAKSKNEPGQSAEAKNPSKQDAEPQPETGTDSKDKNAGESQSGSQSQPEASNKDQSGTDTEGKSQPEAGNKGQSDTGTEGKSQSEAGNKGQSDTDAEGDNKPGTAAGSMVEFEIDERDHSEDVSRKLFEAGLIEDASDFNQYMIEKKMDDHLQTGKYQIPKGATKDEILELIVRLP